MNKYKHLRKVSHTKLQPVHLRLFLLFLIIAVFVLLILRLFVSDLPSNPNVINPDPNQQGIGFDISPTDGSTEVKIVDQKLILPENWTVADYVEDVDKSNYKCRSGQCEIVIIRNRKTDAKLTEAVISSPVNVLYRYAPVLKPRNNLATKFRDQDLNITGEGLEIQNIKLDEQGNIISSVAQSDATFYHLYTCTTTKICFYTGELDELKADNAAQAQEFADLIAQIK